MRFIFFLNPAISRSSGVAGPASISHSSNPTNSPRASSTWVSDALALPASNVREAQSEYAVSSPVEVSSGAKRLGRAVAGCVDVSFGTGPVVGETGGIHKRSLWEQWRFSFRHRAQVLLPHDFGSHAELSDFLKPWISWVSVDLQKILPHFPCVAAGRKNPPSSISPMAWLNRCSIFTAVTEATYTEASNVSDPLLFVPTKP
ncbi:hypothetical protein C8J57DRAFT_1262319 [Mycena rebaudengoi]|nr:hypothetical protein C8J57DRAFT_1262319 [Mycena rebaudengoi]